MNGVNQVNSGPEENPRWLREPWFTLALIVAGIVYIAIAVAVVKWVDSL